MALFEKFLEKTGEIGHVKSVNQTLVHCSGLAGARINEKVIFEGDMTGFVYSVGKKHTEVLLLDSRSVDFDCAVVRTGESMSIAVSADFLGRVVDPFGIPIDKKVRSSNLEFRPLEAPASPLIDRVRINQNLETGVTLVDLLLPIGKGQRQLILGDQKTGKTAFLVQTIVRQTQLGTICIYAGIGRKKSDLSSIIAKLGRMGAIEKTIVVAAPASIPTSLIYLAPFTAFAIAEYFKDRGLDVLVVLDEVSAHAKYYREISNASKKMPGREGYPGDIFYLHAHLIERAGRFVIGQAEEDEKTLTLKIQGKTASITCLPVVETLGGDFTGYIQTNLMSMTDGHLLFDVNQFQQGKRPAVNVGLSVTRIGKQTQKTVERDMAIKVRKVLFEYEKANDVAKFGVELLKETQERVLMGEKMLAVFDQLGDTIVPRVIQLLFIELLMDGFWTSADVAQIKSDKEVILNEATGGGLDKVIKPLQSALELGSIRKFSESVIAVMPELEKICLLKNK